LQDILELVRNGQYSSVLQAESRHQITLAAIFIAGGAVMTRIEPFVGLITFTIGFILAIQSTRKLRLLYPRRIRQIQARIEAQVGRLVETEN
jgi:hypothetical protein